MAYTTIDNPELYFQVKTYTGTGSSQAITLDGDEDMQPDFIWFKNRTSAQAHVVVDAVRGRKGLLTNTTDSEMTFDSGKDFTSFDSDGFTVGVPHQANSFNYNTGSIVAWCWKESTTAGFDIVSYTGNGTAGKTVSHSLSAVPDFFFLKNRSTGSTQWVTWMSWMANTNALYINLGNALGTSQTYLNSTTPTSSVITLGGGNDENKNTDNHILYAWKAVQGFSKFGRYTGNGSTNGPFVYTGFRPAFVIFKKSNGIADWQVVDDQRLGYNPDQNYFNANEAFAEQTTDIIDLVSNGFKIRGDDSNGWNKSGDTYIWIAFAKAPFVNSKGVPCNAR